MKKLILVLLLLSPFTLPAHSPDPENSLHFQAIAEQEIEKTTEHLRELFTTLQTNVMTQAVQVEIIAVSETLKVKQLLANKYVDSALLDNRKVYDTLAFLMQKQDITMSDILKLTIVADEAYNELHNTPAPAE